MTDIETIAETIIYLARQREGKTGLAGAICSVCMEIDQVLMDAMAQGQEGLINGSQGAGEEAR